MQISTLPHPNYRMTRLFTDHNKRSPVHKRFAFVCFSQSLGGLELTTLRIAEAIVKKGHSALLIAPLSSPLIGRAEASGVVVRALAPRWKYGDLLAAASLSRALRENQIEIVVLTQSKDLHLAALASLVFPGPKLVFYQQMDSGYNKRDWLHTWVFSRLSRWITLTEGMKRNVVSFTRMLDRNIEVVPLGINLQKFDSRKYAKASARRLFKFPSGGKIIGVLGRLDPQKGQEILLRSVPGLLKRHPNIHIVIAGDEIAGEAGYRAYLEKMCHTLSVESKVSFLPFTNNVAQFITALDIFVLPSFSETYGLVVIEAMAMGRPVVATRAGGVPEILEHGKTGILVPPRDSQELGNAIALLLTNTSLRSKIVRSARADVLRRFDFALTVERLLDSILKL